MKKLILLLLVGLPVCLLAQNNQKFILKELPPITNGTPLYLLDDKEITRKTAAKIKSEDIASIDIIQPPASIQIYKKKGKNGVVMLISNKVAFEAYRVNLYAFSAAYHEYLDNHKDDSHITYIVDGKILSKMIAPGVLYGLKQEHIKNVEFADSRIKGEAIVKIITTKN